MEQRVQRAIDPIIQRIEEHVHPDDIVAELVTDGWTDREAKAMLLYLIDVSRGMSEVHSELVDGGVDPDRRMLSLVLWRLSPGTPDSNVVLAVAEVCWALCSSLSVAWPWGFLSSSRVCDVVYNTDSNSKPRWDVHLGCAKHRTGRPGGGCRLLMERGSDGAATPRPSGWLGRRGSGSPSAAPCQRWGPIGLAEHQGSRSSLAKGRPSIVCGPHSSTSAVAAAVQPWASS